eukprot:TRINITY_DN6415_c0_g2_i10.p1 TRINITY_DN6415_c0_g2~~TRINITY_DN6415_c0_g2_i10.p1  ORF type:complete len:404 (-),score=108.53 TRINITY_DN6415_c0_g2_i10:6-1217(-)
MGCVPIKHAPKKKSKTNSNSKKPERRSSVDISKVTSDIETFLGQYNLKGLLGYGKDGRVFLASSLDNLQQVAIKVISKESSSIDQLTEEIDNLSRVDHPNIVKYFKHYQSEEYLYVVIEYCAGGELFQQIVDREKFTEEEAMSIMEELLRAVSHCHRLGIIHRDLKPENIMYSSEGVLKIIDFGLSMKAGGVTREEIVGTPCYIAPEVIVSERFTKACDIWSLGIVMHVLLSGSVPIGGNTVEEICRKIKMYRGPGFHSALWKDVSEDAKDLLKKMLDPDPEVRITAEEALRHSWFRAGERRVGVDDKEVIEALKRYSEFPESKKNLLALIVKSMEDKEIKGFQETFLSLDVDKTGLITCSNLEKALNLPNDEISEKELQQLFRKINAESYICLLYTSDAADE